MKSLVFILCLLSVLGESHCCLGKSCSRYKTCDVCVSNRPCRWCPRDGKCHAEKSLVTPCSRAENVVDKKQCKTVLSKYRPELSYKMVLLSAAAYDESNPQECLDNSIRDSDFHILGSCTRRCGSNKVDRCSAYVAISDKEKAIVVAFRGSTDFSQVRHQTVRVLGKPKETFLPGLKGKVQRYWGDAYRDLWSCMKSNVTRARAIHPEYKMWVTGHSLGGAMASLASTQIVQDKLAPADLVVMYTYGMPRVGNYDYALDHDRRVKDSWRVVQYGDPVPHFPTMATPLLVGGPYHHGVEAYYRYGAKDQQSSYKECHEKPFNEDKSCSFTNNPINFRLEKHKMYFSIPVGTFWKTRCLLGGRRENVATLNCVAQCVNQSSCGQCGGASVGGASVGGASVGGDAVGRSSVKTGFIVSSVCLIIVFLAIIIVYKLKKKAP